MLPTLIQIGGFQLTSFGVCLGLGFIFTVFVIWRSCRDYGLSDEKIFDSLVVVTAMSLIGARIAFVITHWSLFSPQLLRIFVIWRFPGLSVWGALIFGLISFIMMVKSQKLPFTMMFDSLGRSFPILLFFISLAVHLDGTIVGKPSALPWSVPAPGAAGRRHPIGLYGMLFALFNFVSIWGLERILRRRGTKLPGAVGWVSFFLLGLCLLLLAILRDDLLYFGGVAVELALSVVVVYTALIPSVFLLIGKKSRENWLILKQRLFNKK